MEKNIDYSKKVAKAVEGYTDSMCFEKMEEMIEVLAKRRSLLNLSFLKFIGIKLNRERALKIMEERNGFNVIDKTFTSTSPQYLNVLFEIYIFVDPKRSVVLDALDAYDLSDKRLFYKYLNGSTGLHALFEQQSENMTYIQYFINDILTWDSIEDELNFVFKLEKEPRLQEIKVNIVKHREKFTNEQNYTKLFKIFNKEETSISYITEEQIEKYKKEIEQLKKEKAQAEKKAIEFEIKWKTLNEQTVIDKKEAKETGSTENKIPVTKQIDETEIKHSQKHDIKETVIDESSKKDEHAAEQIPISVAKETDTSKVTEKDVPVVKQTPSPDVEPKVDEIAKPLESEKPIQLKPKRKLSFAKKNVEVVEEAPAVAPEGGAKKKFSFKKAAAKSKLETKLTYVGLRWSKMTKGKRTIFTQVNVTDNEKCFELADFKPFIKIVAKENKAAAKATGPQLTYCMDLKKSNALSIAMGRIKMSYEDLYQNILEMKCDNETFIRQLVLYMCTPSEFALIKAAEPKTLPNADRFFYYVKDLPEFEEAVASLRFIHLYNGKNFKKVMELTIAMYKRVLESSLLKELFGIMLIVGNQLNRNGFGGKAEGFTFDSLPKFKTNNIKALLKTKFDFTRLSEELGDLNQAESVDALVNEFDELKGAYVKNVVDDKEYTYLCKLYEEMKESQQRLIAYFGVETDDKILLELNTFVKYFN